MSPRSTLQGIAFIKMTGSGNDFVVLDGRQVSLERVASPEIIRSICNRNNGIGADGLVVLEPATPDADVRIHYFNNDGTPADLCGNATLCSTAMAAILGLAAESAMTLTTPAGLIASRVTTGGPEIDLPPVTTIQTELPIPPVQGEQRIGFAIAGIPHVVILCEDADRVDVERRGPLLRRHLALGPAGANVNWVSPLPGGRWRYRTFERGVEGETLACGTGAIATAVLLTAWGEAKASTVTIRTSSGRDLEVRLTPTWSPSVGYMPTLRGEGRVVFHGVIDSI
jgi:diaminopimelate epimerase